MSENKSLDYNLLLDQPSYFVETLLNVENGDPDVPNRVFDYQKDFMDHPSKRKAFVSGRRVGKSRTASWLALWYACTHTEARVLITAKAQRQASELFNQVRADIRKSDLDDAGFGVTNATQTEINFSNGSRIKVLPIGRDGSNIRGFGGDMIIVDEAAFIEPEIFKEVLVPMLAVGQSTLILLSTPLGKEGYLWQKFDEAKGDGNHDPASDEDTDWYAKRVPTEVSPLISKEFIENQKKDLSRRQFEQEYLAQFDNAHSNNLFEEEEVHSCGIHYEDVFESVTREKNSPAYLGVDLAGQGKDESAYISIDAEGNVFDVSSCANGLSASMKKVQELDNKHDYNKILIDSTGLGEGPVEQLQETIGRKVDGFKFTNEKKQSLYNTLKNAFQDNEIRFNFIPRQDEIENTMVSQLLDLEYSYTSGGRMKIEHPSGGHDDFPDALALANWAKSQKSFARSDESMRPFTLGDIKSNR